MGEFSPTTQNGDCEEIANLPTAYGRRRRNQIDAHGSVPLSQIVGREPTAISAPDGVAFFVPQNEGVVTQNHFTGENDLCFALLDA
jgi:hypothetical protein